MPKLNPAQFDSIAEQFTEMIVDGMDYKTMEQYGYDNLIDYYYNLSEPELQEMVDNHDEELWEELVDNVKDVKTNNAVDNVAKCIVDTNGAYAECIDQLVNTMEKG